jgi:hypothetical protein
VMQKWLPKDIFSEAFGRLFGDPEATPGKCVFDNTHTL